MKIEFPKKGAKTRLTKKRWRRRLIRSPDPASASNRRVGVNRRWLKELTAVAIALSLLSLTAMFAASDQTVSSKITWRSLVLLKQELASETNSRAKVKIARKILDVGAPLLAGAMAPSAAKSVAESRKSGKQLPEDQKDYVDFWLLRAVAAVKAENEQAGVEAAKVLKDLGVMDSDKPVEMDVVALLNTEGWIDAPEPAEKQKLIDALKKGDLKNAAAEADALLKNYPQNAKLIAAQKAIQTDLDNATAQATPRQEESTPAEERQTTASEETSGTSSVWLFPYSSSRLLNDDDLAGLDCDEFWRARNEIYARNGYIFRTQRGKSYAANLGEAYHGSDADEDRVHSSMNSVERQNIEIIKNLEQHHHCSFTARSW